MEGRYVVFWHKEENQAYEGTSREERTVHYEEMKEDTETKEERTVRYTGNKEDIKEEERREEEIKRAEWDNANKQPN